MERGASLTLATPTDSVATVADQVVSVTDRLGGVVQSSQVSSGDSSSAQATFDLSIPSGRLDAALAQLSRLAHVRSRQQSSLDVTDPTPPFGPSWTRPRPSASSSWASSLGPAGPVRPASSGSGSASSPAGSSPTEPSWPTSTGRPASPTWPWWSRAPGSAAPAGGAWTLDDGLHTAARVLAVTLIVLLVAVAALGPSALVAAGLIWAVRARAHRRREQALEGV